MNTDALREAALIELSREQRTVMKPTLGPDGQTWIEVPAHWIDGDHRFTHPTLSEIETANPEKSK